MDVLNGMANGPHGQTSGSTGGMSPLTMGLLALLAYKAFKGGQQPQPSTPTSGHPDARTGGLDNWLGGLGNLIASGAAGGVLSNGLGELVRRLQESGQGHVADSWVRPGPNASLTEHDLEKAVGADTLDALARQTGTPRDRLLAELAQRLPHNVDQMTPQGRIPNEREASQWV